MSVSLLSSAVDEIIFSNEFNSILPRCHHHLLSVTCATIQKLSKGQTDGVVKDKGRTAASPPSYTLSWSWFGCSRCSSAERVPHHPRPEKSTFVRTDKPKCPGRASFLSLIGVG